MSWLYFQEDWQHNHSVTFDGVAKLIYISPNVTSISVKVDLYSNWKEWSAIRDNAKYPAAFRTSGGDPLGGGVFTGDIYFLMNDWKIYVDHTCEIEGVIYADDNSSPYVKDQSTQIVTNKVSALVQTIAPEALGIELPNSTENAHAVWTYLSRSLTQTPTYNGPTVEEIRADLDNNSARLTSIYNAVDTVESSLSNLNTYIADVPTAAENAAAVWSHSVRELTTSMTPQQFWDFLLTTPMVPGSAGAKLKEVLTTSNFLALK